MTEKTDQTRAWCKPVLSRLGALRDIAGPTGGVRTNGINTNRRNS